MTLSPYAWTMGSLCLCAPLVDGQPSHVESFEQHLVYQVDEPSHGELQHCSKQTYQPIFAGSGGVPGVAALAPSAALCWVLWFS